MSAARALPFLLAGLALAPAALAAQAATPAVPGAQQSADAPVRAQVAEFVNALNAFDAERLGRTFAEDATVFFPGPPFPAVRVQGRATIQGAFGQLFAALRQRGTRSAGIRPQGLEVQLLGDTALATFLIGGQQEIGRRTLVLRRIAGRWLIVHMHGSSAPPIQRPVAPAPTPAPARAPATAAPTPPRR
ncbi:MAG TPA: nuclear transport factor 2 family protein [Allosphingosinicella sp.]|nr:nuclear transport factor 2 family protein [Allosphingosinicella sp.]